MGATNIACSGGTYAGEYTCGKDTVIKFILYTTIEFTDTSRPPTSTLHFLPTKSSIFH